MGLKYYLTNEGLEEFKCEIEDLKRKLSIIQKEKSDACIGAVGDVCHDNFAYEDAKRNEDILFSQINNLVEKSNGIEIIDLDNSNSSIVNINDMLELEFFYENGSSDIDIFKLTGNWKSKDFDDYQ